MNTCLHIFMIGFHDGSSGLEGGYCKGLLVIL